MIQFVPLGVDLLETAVLVLGGIIISESDD